MLIITDADADNAVPDAALPCSSSATLLVPRGCCCNCALAVVAVLTARNNLAWLAHDARKTAAAYELGYYNPRKTCCKLRLLPLRRFTSKSEITLARPAN